jgi:hypothetical protein
MDADLCPCGCPRDQHHGPGGFECPCGECGPNDLPDDEDPK